MSSHDSSSTGSSSTGLVIAGVSHRFGAIVAADDVSLEVGRGQVHCLLGPSGSGKSTLLRLVAGLEKLQRGTISIGGQTVADPRTHIAPEHRAVGFVFQDYALFPHLNARKNVAFGMSRGTRSEKLELADGWLRRVGLPEHLSAMPHTLSGGQQQRVALARALAREPEVMLLDEPFSGLDQQLRAEVRHRTLGLLRETGVATLMISHDPREALLAADVVSVIRRGRILQSAAPDEVFRRPASRDVAEIFGPVNGWKAKTRGGRVPSLWGELDAPGLEPDEAAVEILVRPDGLEIWPLDGLDSAAPAAHGTVREVTAAGALASVTVDIDADAGAVAVQDLARRGWQEGDRVRVTLLDGAAHVVPMEIT